MRSGAKTTVLFCAFAATIIFLLNAITSVSLARRFTCSGKSTGHTKQEEASPEDVIFDKAEEAEQKEKSKETLMQTIADIDAKIAESDGENRDELKHQKATAEAQLAALVKTKNEEG
jgi:hypothetical protein